MVIKRVGVMGIATCDKGLPAMMLALAGSNNFPGIIVPGGVTLPAIDGEDNAMIQSIGARFAHNIIDKDYAAEMGCRACGSPGGGCQFLGTAATAQVVAEAFGMALPHSALNPSGENLSSIYSFVLKTISISSPVSSLFKPHRFSTCL